MGPYRDTTVFDIYKGSLTTRMCNNDWRNTHAFKG